MSPSPLIAVIDDDAAVRVSLEGLVRSLGYRAAVFGSAEAYLDSGVRPDCIISDVQMPGLSGIALKERLVAEGLEVPVILLTAFADEAARARAERAGATCFLAKPFKAQTLIDCLGRALA